MKPSPRARRQALPAILLALFANSCASPAPATRNTTSAGPTAKASSDKPAASAKPIAEPASVAAKPAAKVKAVEQPHVSAKRALAVLFLDDPPEAANVCLKQEGRDSAIECMLKLRYGSDPSAFKDALAIYRTAGWVAGLEHKRTMDGGWRGMLQLVPEPPVGRHRKHLAWLKHSANEMARFFGALEKHSQTKPKYRWRGLELKFFRSVGRTTPSAYARDWSIAYNVSGSLHRSANAVRETMFHEVFHLNDDGWSEKALSGIHQTVSARCKRGTKLNSRCLAPYAPHHTMVRGGTYYAFEPGNGVWEYAAELAVRYNQEHRALWLGGPAKKPFKCGPPENARAWTALVDTMFAGVDTVPPCK